MFIKTWDSCRSCQTSPLLTVLDLGQHHLTKFYKLQNLSGLQKKLPLELTICSNLECRLVQLRHSFDPKELYNQFWYRSGVNPQMIAELNSVALGAKKKKHIQSVLDIGCNDGTLLALFGEKIHTVGIDPSDIAEEFATPRCDEMHNTFFNDEIVDYLEERAMQFDCITAIAMFYDLDDPADFLLNCKRLMTQDGLLIVQMNYLPQMMRDLAFDNIVHEHATYFSLGSFKWLADRTGFTIVDVELPAINGGSIRIYLEQNAAQTVPLSDEKQMGLARVTNLLEDEEGMNSPEAFAKFSSAVQDVINNIREYLRNRPSGILGASTRGGTLFQAINRPEAFFTIGERDRRKVGLHSAAYGFLECQEDLQVYSNQYIKYLMVMPWFFAESIIERSLQYLQRGGVLLFPLPHPYEVRINGSGNVEKNLIIEGAPHYASTLESSIAGT